MLLETIVEHQPKIRRGRTRALILTLVALGVIGTGGWLYGRYSLKPLPTAVLSMPAAELKFNGEVAVRYPESSFISTVATFRDELFAYLMYQHYRGSRTFSEDELLLHYNDRSGTPQYEVVLTLTNDFVRAVRRVAELHEDGRIANDRRT